MGCTPLHGFNKFLRPVGITPRYTGFPISGIVSLRVRQLLFPLLVNSFRLGQRGKLNKMELNGLLNRAQIG